MPKQTHIPHSSHFSKSYKEIILTVVQSAGIALLLSIQLTGNSQGMEVIGTETQKISEKDLFLIRNEAPYTRDEVINILDPILEDKIKKDFMPFIEVFFEEGFPKSKHSPFAVFRFWNSFFKKLKDQRNINTNDDLHPQIKVLSGDLLCHHCSIFDEKYPTLFSIWMGWMV